MTLRDELQPESSVWDFLAYYLHVLRDHHGLSCAAAGKIANAARQTVSHWESGFLKPHEDQVKALDEHYGTGRLLQLLLHHAKSSHDPDWFRAHVELEARADVIQIYENEIVPGLLQTEDYARTLFTLGREAEVEEQVRLRMSRQAALTRPNPPHLWVILEQEVIERIIGGPKIMREQISRLIELSLLPDIVIRIIPRSVGYHLGLLGPFKILTTARVAHVYTEAAAGGRLTADPAEAARMSERYNLIGADALSREASRDLMRRAQESMT